jgi:hypothetical protein
MGKGRNGKTEREKENEKEKEGTRQPLVKVYYDSMITISFF